MKRIYLICNLRSGKASAGNNLAKIIDIFTKAGFEVTVHTTQSRCDGTTKAKYACESGFDMIVCCGGDGTLNEVISGCMDSQNPLPIGYIPTGSTNDFARSLNIPKNHIEAADAIINGTAESCDIGRIGDRYFTYIAAFGAFTEISYQTAQPVKNVLGHAAYILNGMLNLHKIKASRMRIEYDDCTLEDEFIYGMVTNSTSVAKLLSMPDMEKDDGLFEVTLIRKPKISLTCSILSQALQTSSLELKGNTFLTSVHQKYVLPVWRTSLFRGRWTVNLVETEQLIQ